jgi:hypothetical protein
MFKQYDVVKTIGAVSIPEGTIRRGSKGTIVEIYKSGKQSGYHKEFLDSSGRTKALVVLTADQIKPANKVVQVANKKVVRLPENRIPAAATPAASSSRKKAASSPKTKTVAGLNNKTRGKTAR